MNARISTWDCHALPTPPELTAVLWRALLLTGDMNAATNARWFADSVARRSTKESLDRREQGAESAGSLSEHLTTFRSARDAGNLPLLGRVTLELVGSMHLIDVVVLRRILRDLDVAVYAQAARCAANRR